MTKRQKAVRQYVKGLKLTLSEKDFSCVQCPRKNISDRWSERQWNEDFDVCEICQTFVGLKSRVEDFLVDNPGYELPNGSKINPICPCARPGKLGAVSRAWKKISEYEAKYGEVEV